MNITADLVKELRLRTGVGLMECKKALLEENGNIELSIDNLRKSGKSKAEKKIFNITKHGLIFAKTIDNYGVLLEINCETDFVAKHSLFISFGSEIASTALTKKIKKISELEMIFQEKKIDLINRMNENINIRSFNFLSGKNITSYVHDGRIGVLVCTNNLNLKISKNISMHIAASKPEYLYPKNVPHSVFEREYQIQLELSKTLNKPVNILNKIITGKMNKFTNSISLVGQNFVMDPSKTIGQLLSENNTEVISFIRYEIGGSVIDSSNIT